MKSVPATLAAYSPRAGLAVDAQSPSVGWPARHFASIGFWNGIVGSSWMWSARGRGRKSVDAETLDRAQRRSRGREVGQDRADHRRELERVVQADDHVDAAVGTRERPEQEVLIR